MLKKFLAFFALLLILVSCKKDVTDYGPIDKKIIEDYLKAKGLTAQSTSSGLYYIIEEPGGSVHPNINSKVIANYKGYLANDTVFQEGNHVTFSLSGVIAGWQEGIPLIGLNGKIKLLIPSGLGYGSTAIPNVPANSVLIFDVELVEIY